jgi:hypothetical protein
MDFINFFSRDVSTELVFFDDNKTTVPYLFDLKVILNHTDALIPL